MLLHPLPRRLDSLKRSNDCVELSVVGVRRELDTDLEGGRGVGGEEDEVGEELRLDVGGWRVTCRREGGSTEDDGGEKKELADAPRKFGHEALNSTATTIPCSSANAWSLTSIFFVSSSVPVMLTITRFSFFFCAAAVARSGRIQSRYCARE